MNLRHLGNQELLNATRDLAHQERALGTRLLWHVREVERRRLHLESGFSSLHEYLVKELKYSDGSASRRIRSMALLKELPEIEAALQDGRLSMTTLSATQSFFRREAESGRKVYTPDEKRVVLHQIEDTSREECERILHKISPQSVPKESQRVVSDEESEIRIVVKDELLQKLLRARGLLAGKQRKLLTSYAEILEEMTELYLERNDPVRKFERKARKKEHAGASPEKLEVGGASPEKLAPKARSQSAERRNASANDRFQLYQRDGYQCAYRNSATGRRCEARRWLQPDHYQAWAKRGRTELANMRWLCPGHNQLAAIQGFGTRKMQEYVPSLR